MGSLILWYSMSKPFPRKTIKFHGFTNQGLPTMSSESLVPSQTKEEHLRMHDTNLVKTSKCSMAIFFPLTSPPLFATSQVSIGLLVDTNAYDLGRQESIFTSDPSRSLHIAQVWEWYICMIRMHMYVHMHLYEFLHNHNIPGISWYI